MTWIYRVVEHKSQLVDLEETTYHIIVDGRAGRSILLSNLRPATFELG